MLRQLSNLGRDGTIGLKRVGCNFKRNKDERLAVLKSLLGLLENTEMVSNDNAANLYIGTQSEHEYRLGSKDSFVFTFLTSQVKLSVRTLTQMSSKLRPRGVKVKTFSRSRTPRPILWSLSETMR